MAAGIQGLPFREDLEDIIDTLGQWLGFPTNSDRAVKQAIINTFGKDFGEFVLHGASAIPGMPLDIQGRLGLQNLIPGTALLKPSEKQRGREALDVLGPAGAVVMSAGQAMESLIKGQPANAVSVMLPKAIRDAMRGIDMWSTGEYKDTSGRIIKSGITKGEAIVKGIGFHPESIAKMQRTISTNMDDISIQRTKEDEFAGRMTRAIIDKDRLKLREIAEEMKKWNRANPDYRIIITTSQIRRRVHEMKTSKIDRFVRTIPKELRPTIARDLRETEAR